MINFTLSKTETNTLRDLLGRKLLHLRHDPFDKFNDETVYGRVELFFEDFVVLINYDYESFPLFGGNDDDHPRFRIKTIDEQDAVSALQDTKQIDVAIEETVKGVVLVQDTTKVEWDGKKDEICILKALILELGSNEIAIQGDYMIPLLNIFKGKEVRNMLVRPGDEFDQPNTKHETIRSFTKI